MMTNSSYEEISHIFTTTAGNGKLMTMQLRELENRGLNAAAVIGKALGKTEAEVRDMTTKGKIDFATFASAMDSAFGEHAKDANKTFTGSLSNVNAALSRIGASFKTPYFENMKNVFNALIPVIDKVHTSLKPIIGDATNLMTALGDFTVNKLNFISDNFLTSGFDKLKTELAGTGIAFDDFQNAFIETAKAHGIAVDEMIANNGSFENSLKEGWLTSDIVSEALGSMSRNILETKGELINFEDIVNRVINGDFGNGARRVRELTAAGWDYATVQGIVNDVIYGNAVEFERMSDAQLESIGYTEEQIRVVRALQEQAEQAGTPLRELIENINKPSTGTMLFDSVRNAIQGVLKILAAVRNSWTEVFSFSSGSVVTDIVSKIYDLSQKMIISDETAEKLKNTFKGLFSVFSLAGNIVSGVVGGAFRLLSSIFGNIHIDIVGITSVIGRAINSFREWAADHEILANAANLISAAFQTVIGLTGGVVNKLISVGQAAIKLARNFKLLESAKKIFQIIKDTAKTVFNFLKERFKKVSEAISDFIKKFDFTSFGRFKESVERFIGDIVSDFKNFGNVTDRASDSVRGFAGTVSEYFSKLTSPVKTVKNTLKSFGDNAKTLFEPVGNALDVVKNKFEGFISFFQDKFSSIGLGEILTVAFGASFIVSFKKINDALETIAVLVHSVTGISDSIKGVFKSISNAIDTFAKNQKLKARTEAIYTIAKALAILAASVAILSRMDQGDLWSAVGVIGVLATVLALLSAAFAMIGKIGNVEKISVNIAAVAGSILMLVIAMNALKKLKPAEIAKTGAVIAGLMLTLAASMRIMTNKVTGNAPKVAPLLAFAASLLLIAEAFKKIDKINPSGKTIALIGGMMASLVGLMAATRLAGKSAKSAGTSVLAISAALLIMTEVFKKLNKVKINIGVIGKLILAMGTIAALMRATSLAGADASKAGAGLLAISAAMLLMVGVFKMLNRYEINFNVVKSLLAMVGVIALLMRTTAYAGKDAVKAGVGLLAMSGAMLVLSGVIAILSVIKPDGLKRAVIAVEMLGIMFAGLIYATKYAKNVKGTLITLTVAVSILSVALGVLSMINPDGLRNATVAISALIGMFSLLIASTHFAKQAMGTIAVLLAAIAGIAAIFWAMDALEISSALKNGAGLSLVLLSMTAALAVLNKTGNISMKAAGQLAVMGIIVAELAAVMKLIDTLDINMSIENAVSLSVLLLALAGAADIISIAGTIGPAAFVGLGVFAALVAELAVIIGGLGALVTKWKFLSEWVETGIPILQKLGYGLGLFFGNIVSGFSSGLLGIVPEMGTALSDFMANLEPFVSSVKSIDREFLSGVLNLTGAMIALNLTDLVNKILHPLGGSIDMDAFGDQLIALGKGIAGFSNSRRCNCQRNNNGVETRQRPERTFYSMDCTKKCKR